MKIAIIMVTLEIMQEYAPRKIIGFGEHNQTTGRYCRDREHAGCILNANSYVARANP